MAKPESGAVPTAEVAAEALALASVPGAEHLEVLVAALKERTELREDLRFATNLMGVEVEGVRGAREEKEANARRPEAKNSWPT